MKQLFALLLTLSFLSLPVSAALDDNIGSSRVAKSGEKIGESPVEKLFRSCSQANRLINGGSATLPEGTVKKDFKILYVKDASGDAVCKLYKIEKTEYLKKVRISGTKRYVEELDYQVRYVPVQL